VLGEQVAFAEHVQPRIERVGREALAREVEALRRHLGGAEMVAARGAAQAVARGFTAFEAQHGEAVEPGALAEHLARLGPGRIEQHEQRFFCAGGGGFDRAHHARRLHELAGEHHAGLPLRIGQQGKQRRGHLGARPAEGMGVGHHVGDEPAGVAGLERLGVVHQQAHARTRGDLRAQQAHAVAGHQPAAWAMHAARAAARQEGPRAAGQARVAQQGYRMG
jgi:hypothetical protein